MDIWKFGKYLLTIKLMRLVNLNFGFSTFDVSVIKAIIFVRSVSFTVSLWLYANKKRKNIAIFLLVKIAIIFSPITGCGCRVNEELSSWRVSFIYLDWQPKRIHLCVACHGQVDVAGPIPPQDRSQWISANSKAHLMHDYSAVGSIGDKLRHGCWLQPR